MHTKKSVMNFIFIYLITFVSIAMSRNDSKNDPRSSSDLTLWMDEKQVKMLSGKYKNSTLLRQGLIYILIT